MLNLIKKLREAVKKANENNQRNLYYCILLHEAANEIERLNKKLADVNTEPVIRNNLFKKSKPAPLSLAGSFSNLEVRP